MQQGSSALHLDRPWLVSSAPSRSCATPSSSSSFFQVYFNSLARGFSDFFMEALSAMSVHLNTVLIASHKFGYVVL